MNTAIEKAIPTILSIIGCTGVVVTGIFAARGHVRAIDKIRQFELPEDTPRKEVAKEVVKLTWKDYAPAVVSGAVTIGCIVASNGLHLREEAALAAVVGVIGARLNGMDQEVLKKYGKQALNEMQDDILKREVNERSDKLKKTAKHVGEPNQVMYYEPVTQQFFRATAKDIKDAELHLNSTFQSEGSVTVGEFIGMLPKKAHLMVPHWSDELGWFAGDETFEWAASFSSGLIELNPTPMNVDGWDVNVLHYSIYPSEPGEDYWEIVKGNKTPYTFYHHQDVGDSIDEYEQLAIAVA